MKRHGREVWVMAAAACFGAAVAAGGLEVVYEGGETVGAAAFLPGRVVADEAGMARAVDEARRRLAGVELRLPDVFRVEAAPMRGAAPVRLRKPGVVRPVYAFGAGQLDWLEAVAAGLREKGAQGFVVSARTPADFATATAVSRELGLPDPVPVSGEAFMRMYGASTYPAIVEGSGP